MGYCVNKLHARKLSIHTVHWAPHGMGLMTFRRGRVEETLRSGAQTAYSSEVGTRGSQRSLHTQTILWFMSPCFSARGGSFPQDLGGLRSLFHQYEETDPSRGKFASSVVLFAFWRSPSLATDHKGSLSPSPLQKHVYQCLRMLILHGLEVPVVIRGLKLEFGLLSKKG